MGKPGVLINLQDIKRISYGNDGGGIQVRW
jgi:hypothetical protein